MTLRTGNRQLIKELNIALVINVLLQQAPISRVEISERTGLGRSTVTGIINRLLQEGLVQETGSAETAAGRKPVLLTLNRRALSAIGIKVAPRQATAALMDLKAEVLHIEEAPLNPGLGAAQVIETIKTLVTTVLERTGMIAERLLGIGIVMPGVVNPHTGTAVSSYFLGWADLPVRDILEQELGIPVYVDNDANAMALAEALYGAGRGAGDLLGLTVGVGVGAGIIIGGRIHRGSSFSAGELGHICLVKDGPRCACGRAGCLEAMAADPAIVRRARQEITSGRPTLMRSLVQGHEELITRELVVESAHAGDEAAREVLAEAGRWLGLGVANAVTLLNPDRIVVGGEAVFQAGEFILSPMKETMASLVFPTPTQPLPIVQAALGRHAWIQGAAALVLADAFRVPIHHQDTVAVASRVGQASTQI